jgi:mono/diheme cytochrome c family protein
MTPLQSAAVLLAGLMALGLARAQESKSLDLEAAIKACSGTISDKCIVRHFKDTQEASVIRGRLVFQNYCVLCHGPEGKGDGRAARLHNPPPFNLTLSVAARDYITQVVRKGGEAMGRGKGMPPWGDQLTDEQINDTLNFLFSIRARR